MTDLPKQYSHQEVESKWTAKWLEQGLFDTQIREGAETFSIALPPPNVTGELHMGHALGGTIQDVLIRYNRMLGKDVLWQIGTDHAGIGTQIVVEKHLKKTEHKNKYDYGREEFIRRTKEWKEEYGGKIIDQMKRLAFSPDYDRCRYTMDEHYAQAVKQAFVTYFNQGLIYRGKRIVNWCPKCLTSLSDLEIDKEECNKKLYELKYCVKDGEQYLVVATTRPETMFGDTAVAINPEDERYSDLIARVKAGERVDMVIPLSEKVIPLVLDEHVKTDFGTGALKVTPAHDANDYEIGKRHDLEQVVIMDEQGKMLACDDVPSEFHGMDRYDARQAVLVAMGMDEDGKGTGGNFVKASEYAQEKDLHDRCATEIEPYLSDQWYVKMDGEPSLAKAALNAVTKDKSIEFIPQRYESIFRPWLENIQDWCISRQIWWGHRIPVYYYECEGELRYFASADVAEGELPTEDTSRGLSLEGMKVWQDEDVLDTWFSSALWPFETMKDDAQVYEHYYPTQVLATAREIINLWVTRMIYSSLHFEKQIPYSDILIHPVVQTPDGKRMSKSKGNAINPLELVELYGADASRMWYASVGVHGQQDVRFPGKQDKKNKTWSSDTIEQYRKFANKLFNAFKFVGMQLGDDFKAQKITELDFGSLDTVDQWILQEADAVFAKVEKAYGNYDLATVQSELYEFIWYKFCDWYIEFAKISLNDSKKQILFALMERSLRALHPIMPCITEELWQVYLADYDVAAIKEEMINTKLDSKYQKSICFANYPSAFLDETKRASAEKNAAEINLVIETISAIRNIRQSCDIPWSKEIEIVLASNSPEEAQLIEANAQFITAITKAKSLEVKANLDELETQVAKPAAPALVSESKIYVPLTGIADIDKLKSNIERRLQNIQKDIQGLEARLKSDNFVKNAPADKIDEARTSLEKLLEDKGAFESELAAL